MMKLVKESLFEKFVEDSDPITDMGIGEPVVVAKKIKNFIKLFKNHPDINDNLKSVNTWDWGIFITLTRLYSSINAHKKIAEMFIKMAELDMYFLESALEKSSYGSNVNVIFICKPEYKKFFSIAKNLLKI